MRHRPSTRLWVTMVGATLLSVLLAACGPTQEPGDSGSSTLKVVASTDVWGDVATTVGGDAVTVTSLISRPSQDPHSFEPSATTLLAVSKADVVIENGGGYDDFMERLVETSGSKAVVLNAVAISGRGADAGSEPNEHVWFDLPTVQRLAGELAQKLGEQRPDQADRFAARAAGLRTRISRLATRERQLRVRVAGERIAVTESLPLYLTQAVGLVNATPAAFSKAVENGDDVSPRVLQDTLDLLSRRKVVALVYNEQTTGPVTERVLDAARGAGIPVVPLTETLPSGLGYVTWVQQTLTSLAKAVAA